MYDLILNAESWNYGNRWNYSKYEKNNCIKYSSTKARQIVSAISDSIYFNVLYCFNSKARRSNTLTCGRAYTLGEALVFLRRERSFWFQPAWPFCSIRRHRCSKCSSLMVNVVCFYSKLYVHEYAQYRPMHFFSILWMYTNFNTVHRATWYNWISSRGGITKDFIELASNYQYLFAKYMYSRCVDENETAPDLLICTSCHKVYKDKMKVNFKQL